jgi:hypothetical protein
VAEPKTRPTTETLDAFLARVANPERRRECLIVADLMQKATGQPAVIWGTGIVGFGKYRAQSKTRTNDWPVIAFAPRKNDLTLYIMPGVEAFSELLSRLGKFTHRKSCLYIKRLSDVDMPTLSMLITRAVNAMKNVRVE